MVDARGRVMTQADTSEKYKNEIIDFSKAGKKKNATVYSYQLGTVGKINLMVLPGGGILENVLIMQNAFVVLIAVLLIVCALEITAYYHGILVPLEKFGQKLEDLEKEQSLNEDGNNNLLELESVSGKFKELLRKIQGLKIAIYEKELAEQKAELEYTQEQIKPHFFLNCLSLIHGIADKTMREKLWKSQQYCQIICAIFFRIPRNSGMWRKSWNTLRHISASRSYGTGKKPFPLKRRWTVILENGRFRLFCCRHWWKTPWYTVYPWTGRARFPCI